MKYLVLSCPHCKWEAISKKGLDEWRPGKDFHPSAIKDGWFCPCCNQWFVEAKIVEKEINDNQTQAQLPVA